MAPSESNPVDRGPEDMGKGSAHDRARQLTEKALDAFVEGDENKGGDLVDKAKKVDPSAVREVMDELNEYAGSDHSVPEGNR